VTNVLISGDRVASAGVDGTVRLWDLATGQGVILGKHAAPVVDIAFLSDGRIASAGIDGKLGVWGLTPSGQSSGQLYAGPGQALVRVAISPDGKEIAAGGWDSTIRFWDVALMAPHDLVGHDRQVLDLGFLPDGRLASVSEDRSVRLWDLRTKTARVLRGHDAMVWKLAVSSDGMFMATADDLGVVRVWRTPETGKTVLPENVGRMKSLASTIAAYSGDKLSVWQDGQVSTAAMSSIIATVEISPTGDAVAIGSNDGTLSIQSGATQVHVVGKLPVGVWAMAFSRDGRLLYASGRPPEPNAYVFDLENPAPPKKLGPHQWSIDNVAWGPDDTRVFTTADKDVYVWDLASLTSRVFHGHAGAPVALFASPDGQMLYSAGTDGDLRAWNIGDGSGRVLAHLDGLDNAVLSPDGKTIAATAARGSVVLIDSSSGAVTSFGRHQARQVPVISYSSDGERLVTIDSENVVKVWDVATGDALTLPPIGGDPGRVSFLGTSKQIAWAPGDHSARVVDTPDLAIPHGPKEFEDWLAHQTSVVIDGGRAETPRTK
jgi:WD40 repeat protein